MEVTKNLTVSEFMNELMEEDADIRGACDLNNIINGPLPWVGPKFAPDDVTVWGYCTIHPTAKIGKGVVIGAFTNICGAISIGDNTRIQGFCFIPDGVTIENNVFIGPGVIFTNMRYPQVRTNFKMFGRTYDKSVIKEGASLGAGSIIGPGVTVGAGALVGMGSVVTSNVMPGWLVKGNPARHIKPLVGGGDE
jgi:UDP-2-acetamido-3-amino-2,3-dideoxy-glucuronate N-acetyltransferase